MPATFFSESIMDGSITYALSDGRRITFDRRTFRDVGLAELLRHAGLEHEIPTGRIDVMQHGEVVGSVPATFDSRAIKSTSWLYEPRQGDFVRNGDKLVADRMLGPGDLEAVPGFVWRRR